MTLMTSKEWDASIDGIADTEQESAVSVTALSTLRLLCKNNSYLSHYSNKRKYTELWLVQVSKFHQSLDIGSSWFRLYGIEVPLLDFNDQTSLRLSQNTHWRWIEWINWNKSGSLSPYPIALNRVTRVTQSILLLHTGLCKRRITKPLYLLEQLVSIIIIIKGKIFQKLLNKLLFHKKISFIISICETNWISKRLRDFHI